MAGRYDEYSTKGVGSNFSPSVNFEYRPASWVLLRGTYGEGFRAPAFDELFGNRSESHSLQVIDLLVVQMVLLFVLLLNTELSLVVTQI